MVYILLYVSLYKFKYWFVEDIGSDMGKFSMLTQRGRWSDGLGLPSW